MQRLLPKILIGLLLSALFAPLAYGQDFPLQSKLRMKTGAGATIVTPTRNFFYFTGAGISCADDPTTISSKCTVANAGTIAGTIADTQVAFGTAADTIGGDTLFLWDSTNNRLRIGVAAAQGQALHVKGTGGIAINTGGTAQAFSMTNGVDSTMNILNNSGGEIRFAGDVAPPTANYRFFVFSDGDGTVQDMIIKNGVVGIGSNVDPPSYADNGTSLMLATSVSKAGIQWGNGNSTAVSASDTGRIRYETTGDTLQVSLNAGAYVNIATATTLAAYLPLAGGTMSGAITFSGTQIGTYTLGGTVTVASPILSGSTTGTYTLAGTPTLGANLAMSATTNNVGANGAAGGISYMRRYAAQGGATVTGDFGTFVNWGTGAAVSAPTGSDAAGSIIMTSGTTAGASPSFVYTFRDEDWAVAPICLAALNATNDLVGQFDHNFSVTTTVAAATFTWQNATPADSKTFTIAWHCIGQ